MEIVSIFANKLYAFQFETERTDEHSRLFDLWFDVEYLENFFEENKQDLLSGFFNVSSVEEAVRATRKEAKELEKELKLLSTLTNDEKRKSLDGLFKPLEKHQYAYVELIKSKAYGSNYKSWLRLYAIRVGEGVYVITGGAIKLTPQMNDRPHLQRELNKLSRCRDYLIEQGILDEDGLQD
jgi:hypothetical protein